ncbi:hypothetical protein VB776_14510 [Arcicella sp. DC2W]|uniref:HTH luxR-type domain-containing protein n=1 Tax=Arcicella gelida TaxID=2984195 RepID=A0ABU5S6P1_9BACT|nr:hypothetical protein [Arcicella sp. DC2W]MEA5404140.1 hypothetical protein [Arcicella sp. DC2W]
MTQNERYRFVHDFPFWKIDNVAQLSTILTQMIDIASEKKDYHSQLELKYYTFLISGHVGFKIPNGRNANDVLSEMQKNATQQGYEVEEVVAFCHLTNNLYLGQKLSKEQYYLDVQYCFEQLQRVGFEKFKDYNVAGLLFDFGKCLWDLGDLDKAYQYLSIAERFIEPTIEGGFHYTQVLSYLQTYWKDKKDYDKSIFYAKKILNFHQNLQIVTPEQRFWNHFWLNFSSIDIASALIEQGKIKEGELYANKSYELIKSQFSLDSIVSMQAEFDALMVLIPIRLKLGKAREVDSLLERATTIRNNLVPKGLLDYFKNIKLYKYSSEYEEIQGNFATALHYTHLAQKLQDSLNLRNDTQKLSQMQLRYEVEKYAGHLKMIENEKQLQKYLRNAVLVILLLVVGFAYVNLRRLHHKHHQKEKELANAQYDLNSLTQHFRKMSDLAESLRHENEKLIINDNQNEYLEQLISSTILTDEDWTNFKMIFEKVHPGYIQTQKEKYPDLTNAETRLLILEKLNLSAQEMANMIGVNKNTIHQTRLRLRRKTNDIV